jgi:hypothetical protein
VLEADAWDSTISFAPGIPATLGGTLELTFADGVDVASQVGRTFDLFDWTGVMPTGAFNVASPYAWDLSKLYAAGEVTLAAAGGPLSGDFNGDSVVDGGDLLQWQGDFGVNNLSDGDSDGADFLAWQRQLGFGASAQSSGSGLAATSLFAAVPEPAVSTLLPLAGGALLLRNRPPRRLKQLV